MSQKPKSVRALFNRNPKSGRTSESDRYLEGKGLSCSTIRSVAKGRKKVETAQAVALELEMRRAEGRVRGRVAEIRSLLENLAGGEIDWGEVRRLAFEKYVPPTRWEGDLNQDEKPRVFAPAWASLSFSRHIWPPEPRRGSSYSKTQMREEIASGLLGLPVYPALDVHAASRLKRILKRKGMPENVFSPPKKWEVDTSYYSSFGGVKRAFDPRTYSVREVEPNPSSIEKRSEEWVFSSVEAELKLWEWLVRTPWAYDGSVSPENAFKLFRKATSQVGDPVTSTMDLCEKVIYEVYDITLGETTFGGGRKKPAYANKAQFEKEVPNFSKVWRGAVDLNFDDARRRREEYERAIEQAEKRVNLERKQRLDKGVRKVVYPFFGNYVDYGWSRDHFGTVVRKWNEYFAGREQSPELHRNEFSSGITIEGEGVGWRHEAPKWARRGKGSEIQALFYYVAHLRRRLVLADSLSDVRVFRVTDRAWSDARKATEREKDVGDLYAAVDELVVDMQTSL